MRLIVIGGVAAGMSAASKAARTNQELSIDVYTNENYISYSGCSLPYYTQGIINNENCLIARTKDDFAETGVMVHTLCTAKTIDPKEKKVLIEHPDGNKTLEAYDKLVIATGASPVIPALSGIDLPGVFVMKQITDANAVRAVLAQNKAKRAIIVGGGFIGIEMAEALTEAGLKVTIVEMAPQIMTLMDMDMALMVQAEMEAHGIDIKTNTKVVAIDGVDKVEGVKTESENIPADIVIMAIGVKPNSEIAQKAGIELGQRNAIKVNSRMETNIPDIYAAGDCATAYHLVSDKDSYVPLGTTANKQGKIAGENVAGGQTEFRGIIGTTIFKIMDMEGARTGLSSREAKSNGFEIYESNISSYTRASGYPGRGPITIKLIIEKESNRLLGGQIFGAAGAAKRIDVLAALVQLKHTVEDLASLDLAYAPPFSPVWDPLLVAANQAMAIKKAE